MKRFTSKTFAKARHSDLRKMFRLILLDNKDICIYFFVVQKKIFPEHFSEVTV